VWDAFKLLLESGRKVCDLRVDLFLESFDFLADCFASVRRGSGLCFFLVRQLRRKGAKEGEEFLEVVHGLFPLDVIAGEFVEAAFAFVVLGDSGFDHWDEVGWMEAAVDSEAATAGFAG
jgi:hypothetical protein